MNILVRDLHFARRNVHHAQASSRCQVNHGGLPLSKMKYKDPN